MPAQCRLTDLALIPADVHGCPGCAHTCIGPCVAASPNVFVNSLNAERLHDPGIHAACCGPNTWNNAQGSSTVFINSKPAVRLGDVTRHCGGLGSMITASPNVFTGGPPTAIVSTSEAVGRGGLVRQFGDLWIYDDDFIGPLPEGHFRESEYINYLLDKIGSGPLGKALLDELKNGPNTININIDKNGYVDTPEACLIRPLDTAGGGLTVYPASSGTGDIEVYIDPTLLVQYQATNGSIVSETPEGLLLHELGHAILINRNDPSHFGHGDPEKGSRDLTNPIRNEMGMPEEKTPLGFPPP